MTELLVAIPLTAALIAAVFFYRAEAQAWRAERADLLNRIMAKDWQEYRAATFDAPHHAIPQFSTDELEAQWFTAHARESATVLV